MSVNFHFILNHWHLQIHIIHLLVWICFKQINVSWLKMDKREYAFHLCISNYGINLNQCANTTSSRNEKLGLWILCPGNGWPVLIFHCQFLHLLHHNRITLIDFLVKGDILYYQVWASLAIPSTLKNWCHLQLLTSKVGVSIEECGG